MNPLQVIIAFLGRAALSLIFILAGLRTIVDWQKMEQNFVNALCETLTHVQGLDLVRQAVEFALPWVPMLLALAAGCQLLGGLLVFFGIKVRFGAFLLLLVLIPVTFCYHHFWYLQGAERELQIGMFLKNLSIFGGLLVVLALGKGGKKAAACAISSEKEE